MDRNIAQAPADLAAEASSAIRRAQDALMTGTVEGVDGSSSALSIAIARMRALEKHLQIKPESGLGLAREILGLQGDLAQVGRLLDQTALYRANLMRRLSSISRDETRETTEASQMRPA